MNKIITVHKYSNLAWVDIELWSVDIYIRWENWQLNKEQYLLDEIDNIIFDDNLNLFTLREYIEKCVLLSKESKLWAKKPAKNQKKG